MFTERHYVVLTKLIKRNLDLDLFTEDLIQTLKADNKNFNELMFRQHIRRDV